jgi:translation initiation factor IF-1
VSSDDKPRFDGRVEAAKGNGFFTVSIQTEKGPTIVLCQLSGKIRTHNIKIVDGDIVEVELDPYNMTRGRIIYRKK